MDSGNDERVDAFLRLRFFMPSAGMARYVSTYYHMEIISAPPAPLEDYLHPEWGNIRICHDADLEAGIGEAALRLTPELVATGPTSLATRFRLSRGSFWGIGLLPLGWARFVQAPADAYADTFCDARADTAFSLFEPLVHQLGRQTLEEDAALIDRHLTAQCEDALEDDALITRFHAALVDSNYATVGELVDAAGIQIRTLERLSRRAFGFPPKLLLRRQRFLRSLSRYMLDPSLSWLRTLDTHYHDQAHFVRDFKRFMTMTPNQYRQIPHPVLMAAVRGRMEAAGQAMQSLHQPGAR